MGSPGTGAPLGAGPVRSPFPARPPIVLSGRPSAAAPASGTSGATGATGGGASGGTTGGTGGGANGGTTGGTGGGASGGTTGTTGGGASGPGRAIGIPDMSAMGAHAVPAAGSVPAEFWRHSEPPACAIPGLNPKATQHIPAPTAATLLLSRSKIATGHHSIRPRASNAARPNDVVNLSGQTASAEYPAPGCIRKVTFNLADPRGAAISLKKRRFRD
jgi:hypothetical protein